MHIFIDANIYLSFYETSPDALFELAKIATVVERGTAVLWLPDQVKREFWKNRDSSISVSLKTFQQQKGLGYVPCLIKEHSDFSALKELSRTLDIKRAEIAKTVQNEVLQERTKADVEIRKLFSLASEIDTSGIIFQKAHERALRHTPPGKSDGLGDRLSWVALLEKLPERAELHVISADNDFAGESDINEISPYLKFEWESKKNGRVKLWKRLSQFLAAHFPDAATAIEMERNLMIEALRRSSSFSKTHEVIAEFTDISHLNPSLANRLALALLDNDQVRWILCDEDVREFAQKFLSMYGTQIDSQLQSRLQNCLEP